ncbi:MULTISPECIES: hypothetical protein [Oerskovia]|uniref:Uncharacterized protein n=1 Tax=Oerskovia paurometabola TaxID=162170 RepID=A0ABW1XDH5_9CELL|nr:MULTISPECIES: hypothetical protein [Oerskovia]MBM7496656.1 hypothetical protein [Oerskovia paurometabola]
MKQILTANPTHVSADPINRARRGGSLVIRPVPDSALRTSPV